MLHVAIKAVNETMVENGLVPARLVFGIIPRFSILSTGLPRQKERMDATKLGKADMNSIIAEGRVKSALFSNIPPAAYLTYKLEE